MAAASESVNIFLASTAAVIPPPVRHIGSFLFSVENAFFFQIAIYLIEFADYFKP